MPRKERLNGHRPADQDESSDEAIFFGKGQRRLPGKHPGRAALRFIPYLPGFGVYSKHFAPRRLRLEQVTVDVPALPAGLEGLRIGFMTDTHHEPGRPQTLLKRAVELLNDARPDLICLGGDYVVSRAAEFSRAAALLARLSAPLGVFGVLGNHDYWAGADHIAAKVAASGVTILRNQARRVTTAAGADMWLIGLDDAARRRADLRLALAGAPETGFRLLLAHEPDIADNLGARVDLQLSGHTHGGQVILPWIGAPLLPRLGLIYTSGLYRLPTHALYVGRGVGGVPPYIRLNCPPEVTVLTLGTAPILDPSPAASRPGEALNTATAGATVGSRSR